VEDIRDREAETSGKAFSLELSRSIVDFVLRDFVRRFRKNRDGIFFSA
jgi:hypothetical protein